MLAEQPKWKLRSKKLRREIVCFSRSAKSYPSNERKCCLDERARVNLWPTQSEINLVALADEVIEPVHVYTLWSLKWQSKSPVPYQLKPEKEKRTKIWVLSLLWWIVCSIVKSEFWMALMYVPVSRCRDSLRRQKALCSIYIWKKCHSIITKINSAKEGPSLVILKWEVAITTLLRLDHNSSAARRYEHQR